MTLEANTVVLLAGLGINLIITAVVGTWKLSRVELSLHKAIVAVKQEIEESVDTETNHFGEAIAGLRQGVALEFASIRKEFAEEQKYSRDTFMRRDSFYKVQEALQSDIRGLGIELKGRLERMETKIDSKT